MRICMTSLHLLFRNGDEDDRVRVKLAVRYSELLCILVGPGPVVRVLTK